MACKSDEKQALRKVIQYTLVVPRRRDNSILLARKTRGLGQGKWIGFGGKVEPNEDIDEAAIRELHEETGIMLPSNKLSKIGLLLFSFACKPNLFMEVHVYDTFSVSSIPTLCDEFQGTACWFPQSKIPCEGQRFKARFWYSDLNTITRSKLVPVHDEEDSLRATKNWFLRGDVEKHEDSVF